MSPPAPYRTLGSDDRITAACVVSEREAYVGFSTLREPRGPNGEVRLAHLIHTTDGGKSWIELDWRRTLAARLTIATWPPEDVLSIARPAGSARVTIEFRDEWVPFEPGGESLWRAERRRNAWSVRRIRLMDYDRADSALDPKAIALALPPTIRDPFRAPVAPYR